MINTSLIFHKTMKRTCKIVEFHCVNRDYSSDMTNETGLSGAIVIVILTAHHCFHDLNRFVGE